MPIHRSRSALVVRPPRRVSPCAGIEDIALRCRTRFVAFPSAHRSVCPQRIPKNPSARTRGDPDSIDIPVRVLSRDALSLEEYPRRQPHRVTAAVALLRFPDPTHSKLWSWPAFRGGFTKDGPKAAPLFTPARASLGSSVPALAVLRASGCLTTGRCAAPGLCSVDEFVSPHARCRTRDV